MRDQIGRTPLERAMILAARVIERRNSIPILDCLFISSDGTRVTFEGSDLDNEVAVEVDAPMGEFIAAVPYDALRRAVDWYDGAAILAKQGSSLKVGDVFTIPTADAGEFPRMKSFDPTARFTLPAAQLLSSLKAVARGISTEETRYYLNGVYFHCQPKALRIVTTDGHRAYVVTLPLPAGLSPEGLPGAIVPRKTIHALIAALELADSGSVELRFAPRECRAAFDVGSFSIMSKLIDGTFPEYSRVIPTANEAHWTVAPDELRRAAKAALALDGSQRGNPTHMALDFAAGVMRSTRSTSGASFSLPLPGETEGKLPPVVGCNAAYLGDAIEPFADLPVRISFATATDPILIQAKRSPVLVVLMPTRHPE